ncbi:MAG TPA: tRNA glutamyl-Q(34) synthetase GluQRS, partial [Edaphobacter sp.]|nr:tRNA glutamyl-Q(34) synthetase GluQRS [Edaphobacter sp.]
MTRHPYIGRLAPSPTGLLHLGHAATFHTAHQRAQAADGTLLLRIEDLDTQRSKPHLTEAILEDLAWLGVAWQPPVLYQSQRLSLYREALDQLLITGHIYPCHCSRKDLAAMMHAPHEDTDDEPVYPGICRPALDKQQRETPFQPNINYRFRVPDGETITFVDKNLGPQSLAAGKDFGDFLVWRRDGLPSYQLACVVDDAGTDITEVVRGRDLLKSTARQILLQRALMLSTPAYFHTHLLTDEQGTR